MNSILINGVKLAYEEHGEGSPVVLVCGFSSNHSYWAKIVPTLLQRHRVLLLDNRGVGESDDPSEPYTAATMAQDVLALCDHLSIETFDLVGQSMGTSIGIEAAVAAPDRIRRLALLNGYIRLRPVGLAAIEYAIERMRLGGGWREANHVLAPWCVADKVLEPDGSMDAILDEAEANPNPPSLNALDIHARILHEFDASPLLCRVSMPTLCLSSTEDMLALPTDSEALAEGIPQARLEWIVGGHDVVLEEPERVGEILVRFLAEE